MMAVVELRNNSTVELVDVMGNDELICAAAKVSTLGARPMEGEATQGFLNFLMRNRHGSPFEHGAMTFRITTLIAVWREFMRHRIGFSYNEQSARYMELEACCYIPREDRPLVQVGKPGHYTYEVGAIEDWQFTVEKLAYAYEIAFESYQAMLERGIAKEVARFCLPVATYSTAYVTCNPRSLMAFLSLRTKDEGAKFPSYPQFEIEQVALKMEGYFAEIFPMTHDAFDQAGRVSP